MLRRLRLMFVLATGLSAAEVTLEYLALEGTKRVRPDTTVLSGPVGAHFVFCGHCRGQNSGGQISLRRDGSVGGYHPANV